MARGPGLRAIAAIKIKVNTGKVVNERIAKILWSYGSAAS